MAGIRGTTILCVRRQGKIVMVGDGQVTYGSEILKHNARKVRTIQPGIIGGFAGATADAFTLFEKLEEKLEKHSQQVLRSCVELAKEWRSDKMLRKLEAMMIVASKDHILTLSGVGDVIEPTPLFEGKDDTVISIGSGSTVAKSAAQALLALDDSLGGELLSLHRPGGFDAETVAMMGMEIAAETCIYTNDQFIVERID